MVDGYRLDACKSDNADTIPNGIPSVNAVEDGNTENSEDEPSAAVLSYLNAIKLNAFLRFLRLWNKFLHTYRRYISILKRAFGQQMTLMLWEICSVGTRTVFRDIALIWGTSLLTLSALSSRKMRNW